MKILVDLQVKVSIVKQKGCILCTAKKLAEVGLVPFRVLPIQNDDFVFELYLLI